MKNYLLFLLVFVGFIYFSSCKTENIESLETKKTSNDRLTKILSILKKLDGTNAIIMSEKDDMIDYVVKNIDKVSKGNLTLSKEADIYQGLINNRFISGLFAVKPGDTLCKGTNHFSFATCVGRHMSKGKTLKVWTNLNTNTHYGVEVH